MRFVMGLSLTVMVAFLSVGAFAVTKTTTASGNWNANIWNPSGTPGSGDDVVVSNGHNVTVNVNASCASLTVSSGGSDNTVTVNSGISLTVSGAVTINAGTGYDDDKTIAVGSGSLSCTSITMAAPAYDSRQCQVTISAGTVTVSGNITMNGTAVRNLISFSGAGILNVGGSISGGDLVPSTGSVNYNGSAAQTVAINADYVYYNLTVNNTAGATLQAAITTANVLGNVRVQSGVLSNGGFAVAGNGTRTFEVANGAEFRLTGSTVFPTGFGTVTLGSSSTVNYAGTAQTISNRTYGNLTLSGSGTKTLAGNTTVNGMLSLQGTAGFANGGHTLTYGPSASLEYKGSAAQSTGAEFLEPMGAGIFINNAAGVSLSAARTLNGTLTLSSGVLSLGSNNLTLGSAATVAGTPSSSSMIVTDGTGELRKMFTGPGSFVFPVGDKTGTAEYSPVTLGFTSGTFGAGAYVGVKAVNQKHPNNTSTTDYLNRYWTLNANNISGFSSNVTFAYVPADVVGTESNIYSGGWNGSSWTPYTPANPVTHELAISGLTGFSQFSGGEHSALPVQLSSFRVATAAAGRVELRWSTVTETNNYGFEVERSAGDREHYVTIAGSFVAGHGTTLEPQQYVYVDEHAGSGVWYYRLKQMDLDGAVHYSDGVQVSMVTDVAEEKVPTGFALQQNYPNPFNPQTQIRFSVESAGRAVLTVYNALGQEVATLYNDAAQPGHFYTVKVDGSGLASGLYFYRLVNGTNVEMRKMLLVK